MSEDKSLIQKLADPRQLAQMVDVLLRAAMLLIQNGADCQRIERNLTRLAEAMGMQEINVFISYNSIMITSVGRAEFRTKIKSIRHYAVNLAILESMSKMSWQALDHRFEADEINQELDRISEKLPRYNRWVVVAMVGLACAAFSQLMGGDIPAFVFAFFGAAMGLLVRQEILRRKFNIYLSVVAGSFISAFLGGSLAFFYANDQASLAMASSVLYLVPGVPLINAVKDVVDGYTMVGLSRGLVAAFVFLCIALGIVGALKLTGITL